MASLKDYKLDGVLERTQSGPVVGHLTELDEKSHTKRDFGPLTIIALGFNICNSWVAVATSLAIAISAGGKVTLIYGVIIISVVYLAVAASLAELASVYPTAGGQYHFSSILAPAHLSRGISYACGMIGVFSWIALCASVDILLAQLLLALPQYFVEGYAPTAWQYFLVFQALNVFFLLYNMFALKRTIWIHDVGFALTLTTFCVVFITCLVRSTKQSSAYVWTNFDNNTGWPSGIEFITGLVTPAFMFAGLDGSLHLAEECTAPERLVPRALMVTATIGLITGFSFSVAMCYGITDLQAMFNSTMPIYELWRQTTRSDAAATAFVVALICILLFTGIAMQQTASHMIWALARDRGLAFSGTLATMYPSLGVPAWGLIANAVVVLIAGCIYLASTAAFNALISCSIILQMVSFAIPCLLLLVQKRSTTLLPRNRAFRLPDALGWFANIAVVGFAVVEVVFFQFPSALPVSGASMNYTCAVLGIMALFGLLNWCFYARKNYHGPRIELD